MPVSILFQSMVILYRIQDDFIPFLIVSEDKPKLLIQSIRVLPLLGGFQFLKMSALKKPKIVETICRVNNRDRS